MRLIFIFSIVILIVLIYLNANSELYISYQFTPPGHKYIGATGYYFDYYQFLSWMRDGVNGKILIQSRYIPNSDQPALLHPFFPIIGKIGNALGLNTYVTYHLIRNLLIFPWLVALFVFTKKILHIKIAWKFAILLLLLASGFPKIDISNSSIHLSSLITFWPNFYTFAKFNLVPHHLLFNSLLLFLILQVLQIINNNNATFKSYLILPLLSVSILLLNPSKTTFFLILLILVAIWHMSTSHDKSAKVRLRNALFVIIFFCLPLYLYNAYVVKFIDPWKYYFYNETISRYPLPIIYYLGSLGPLLFPSLLSILFIRNFQFPQKLLYAWLVTPILIYPFSGRQIPMAMSRLFILDVFIPQSILSVYFFYNLLIRFQKFKTVIYLFVILIFSLLLPGFYLSINNALNFKPPFYYNVFLPPDLKTTISYLQFNTKTESVILAGEYISNLLPAVTDNRVVLGREDTYKNYPAVSKIVASIYFRQISDEEITTLLKTWQIAYIIFGIDNISYSDFQKKGNLSYLQEVYKAGDISVVKVN